MKIIKALGLDCPQPVLLLIKAIKNKENPIKILVDNEAAFENVKRSCENNNYKVKFVKKDEIYEIEAKL